jgi:hypothetical protein
MGSKKSLTFVLCIITKNICDHRASSGHLLRSWLERRAREDQVDLVSILQEQRYLYHPSICGPAVVGLYFVVAVAGSLLCPSQPDHTKESPSPVPSQPAPPPCPPPSTQSGERPHRSLPTRLGPQLSSARHATFDLVGVRFSLRRRRKLSRCLIGCKLGAAALGRLSIAVQCPATC